MRETSFVVYVHALMTQKLCTVGMRNAILRNHLKLTFCVVSSRLVVLISAPCTGFFVKCLSHHCLCMSCHLAQTSASSSTEHGELLEWTSSFCPNMCQLYHISQVCKRPSRLNHGLNRKRSFTLQGEILTGIDPQRTQETAN